MRSWIVQEGALGALRNVTVDPLAARLGVEAGALEAVAQSLLGHCVAAPLQQSGCGALRNLTTEPDAQAIN